MIREQRQLRLAELIHKKQYVGMEELTGALGVSKSTIRRDLALLSATGAVALSRGGAISCLKGIKTVESEPAYETRKSAELGEKERIALAAAAMAQPGNVIIMDAGTTTRAMTPHLAAQAPLTVVTNDILIAADLAGCDNIEVTVTGGQVRKGFYTLRGFAAEELMRMVHADIAFMGLDALDLHYGAMLSNFDEVSLKRCMISIAKEVVLLCDHTKFSASSFMSFCPIAGIHTLITGRQADAKSIARLREAGVEVIAV